MSDELDPRAIEAALDAFRDEPLSLGWTCEDRERVTNAIRAYLDAIKPEGKPDRIAVVINLCGEGEALIVHEVPDEGFWQWLENQSGHGPFARAIVECYLPRPSEPVTVKGRVE